MARQPLKPKPVPAIVPIALKLKALGYDPIPLYSGKGKPPKGWPTNPNTPEDINGWNGRTVALRMRGHADLFAIDMDIQHDGVLRAIIARYQERWPDFMARCVVRHSGAVKVMLIGRLSTARRYMHSGRYGVTEEHKGGNRVELFTANDARYIAVWGMHSTGRDYGFDGPEIVEVEYRALPEFLEDDLNELLTIANEEMEAAGLALSEKPGEDKGDVIYDLTPDMVAELEDGRTMTLKELEHEATGQFVYIHGRLFDPGSGTDNRIKCKTLRSCGLTMWDWGDGCVEHRWKHLGPQPEVLTPLLKGLVGDAATQPQATMFRSGLGAQAKAAAQAASEVAPAYPDDGAPFNVRLLWLLRAYGYCALNDSVIALFEAGMDCEIRPAAFERRFAAWYREEVTRNTVKRIPATHDWGLEEQRRHVDGARMHPGQAFPLYREGGKLWKNVYQRPRHEGTGDLEPFMRFFERFIPDRREREWLLDWMAHKQRRPDIPGSARKRTSAPGGSGPGAVRCSRSCTDSMGQSMRAGNRSRSWTAHRRSRLITHGSTATCW
jgi:hypothetical protein